MSSNTRQQIANCFIGLVERSPCRKAITVTSIVKELEIDRKTFYNHFGNTADLVIWIYRDALARMLGEPDFLGSELVFPDPSSNDIYADIPFYARFKNHSDNSLNQRPYYMGIGHIFQNNREYYERIFAYGCYIDFFGYIVSLYLPVIRDDILFILGPERKMPDVAINFLAEYHTMGIFGRLRYHYSHTKKFMMQSELDPFWNYAHETLKRTIDSMFEEKQLASLPGRRRKCKQVYTSVYS